MGDQFKKKAGYLCSRKCIVWGGFDSVIALVGIEGGFIYLFRNPLNNVD
jgi:hypothetical protein